jgi:hypothetical protein
MGTKLTPSATLTFGNVVSPNPGEIVRATGGLGVAYRIAGPTSLGDVYYTGNVSGISVVHLGGINKTLLATLIGSLVQIQLGTNGAGTPTSTPIDIKNELLAKGITQLTPTYFGGTGIAGIWETPLKLDGDIFGSIRPALQGLLDSVQYLFNGVVLGGRSLKKFLVDTTGDVDTTVTAVPNGEGWLTNALQVGIGAAQRLRQEAHRLKWLATGTGATDANPPPSQALANDLRAKGIVKAQGTIITNGTGGITLFNALSCSIDISVGHLRVTMLTPMADTNYNIALGMDDSIIGTGGGWVRPGVNYRVISTTQFLLPAYNSTTSLDPTTQAYRVSFIVTGQQNT